MLEVSQEKKSQNSLFGDDGEHSGFRLHRLEVLNWGIYDQNIWSLAADGKNTLLVGDIGSGKSTLADAIVTLLVPPRKIIYNRAAGGEFRERTLLSYVRGEYKSQKNDLDNRGKPVCFREANTYSVILASFFNEGYGQYVTLAQVFWLAGEEVRRFYVVAESDMTIKSHFTGFDGEIAKLRKRLTSKSDTIVGEHFNGYSSKFRNLFGLPSEKALDLFSQTVSMKSVASLNEFVREHMIDSPDSSDRIDALRKNYENLTRAHDLVQKAKTQLHLLQPIVADSAEYEKAVHEIADIEACRQALPFFIAERHYALLETHIARERDNLDMIDKELSYIQENIDRLRAEEDSIQSMISANEAGRQVADIDREIKDLEERLKQAREKAKEFSALCGILELPSPIDQQTFSAVLSQAEQLEKGISTARDGLTESRDSLMADKREVEAMRASIEIELTSLRGRKSQIPASNLQLRQSILSGLGIDEKEMPFVGELLQVKEKESAWEGSIERVLHGFGLSLLVPEKHYHRVSSYVDKTNLRSRIVYFRVPQDVKRIKRDITEDSLYTKVEMKTATGFDVWLSNELIERYSFICCHDMEQFRAERFAITRNGQIKTGGVRHEKDDRKDIHDRRNYILGWSNAQKIAALEKELTETGVRKEQIDKKIKSNAQQQEILRGRETALHDLLKFKGFGEIDWQRISKDLDDWQKLKIDIEESSEELRKLRKKLESVQEQLRELSKKRDERISEQGVTKKAIEETAEKIASCKEMLNRIQPHEREQFFPMVTTFAAGVTITLKSIERAVPEEIRTKIDAAFKEKDSRKSTLMSRVVSGMQDYINRYPVEASSVDAAVESIAEFRGFLRKIEEEELPRFEARFRELLQEGVINDIAMFRVRLRNELDEIEEKIDKINRSLKAIEYHPGTYIKIVYDKAIDVDIRAFQEQLRGCLEHMDEKDLYSEEKFYRVKAILDRFNSSAPIDKAWTEKVTDVRKWYEFSASERFVADDTEKEFYSGSSKKSGGEKEMLAYTILASALVYQFGLEWGQGRSRTFRFALIDEAFGRGSDASTRYGLELFKKLDLQLLVITPIQKVNVIENYISSVNFVWKGSDDRARLRNLTVEQYREERDQWRAKNTETT